MENQGSYYGSWDYPYHTRDMFQSFESQPYFPAPEYQFNEEPFQDFSHPQQYQPQYDFHPEFQWQNQHFESQYQDQYGYEETQYQPYGNPYNDQPWEERNLDNVFKGFEKLYVLMKEFSDKNDQALSRIESESNQMKIDHELHNNLFS